MEQNNLISVIVPVYNVERYLSRCVDSILCQTYPNLEIILVDDGAKDTSGQICDAYEQKDSRIRVIHKENGGLSSARNAGIDIARGDYLCFVDSDDWIEPDAVENMLQCALRNRVEMVIGGRYDVSESSGEKKPGLCPVREEVLQAEDVIARIFLWDHCDSAAWDKLFSRRLFREIRFPVGMVCEDLPIMYRIILDAGKVAMHAEPIYNYFHRKGSITYSALSEKNFHYSRHTAVIYPYICEHYPGLRQEARYLRVRGLVYSVQSVDLAAPEDRKRFQKECRQERKELRKHLGFLWTYPAFTRRKRIEDTLMAFGLYRAFRKLWHGMG